MDRSKVTRTVVNRVVDTVPMGRDFSLNVHTDDNGDIVLGFVSMFGTVLREDVVPLEDFELLVDTVRRRAREARQGRAA